jgi:N-acyl-D-amino-acid deacylase
MIPNASIRLPLLLSGLLSLAASSICGAQEQDGSTQIHRAVIAGLRILEKGTINYAEQRNCFTCHHQTLPMLAQVTARDHGFKINGKLLQEQARFTHESFSFRHATLRKGNGIGGRSMTVGFACWALQLADWKPDETTGAMVEYLLKSQKKDGNYFTNQSRPPLEDSPATSVAIATYYQQEFATKEQEDRVKESATKALAWLLAYTPTRQEDFSSRLWGLHLLGADREDIATARALVLAAQRKDGGWAQLPKMPADSYATGQALWMLQTSGLPTNDPAYQRGVKFLLQTQRDDGSWLVKTRSKAIQKYFESGFPHGKDQFISVCGTSWAVAALAATQSPPEHPSP